ncbi:MAG: ABC transporter ATP-binding protein [Candidatus Diapherotrites archaeon]
MAVGEGEGIRRNIVLGSDILKEMESGQKPEGKEKMDSLKDLIKESLPAAEKAPSLPEKAKTNELPLFEKKPAPSGSILVVERLGKKFGSKEVLAGVSFSMQAGRIFGLLGPNGAGKSTLIKILTGFIKQDSGNFSFKGKQLEKSGAGLRKHIGVVPQEEMFYRKFSVEENLSLFGSLYGLSGKRLEERKAFLLKWLGLVEFRKKKAEQLSGGYRRLLNIACSIIHDPEIVFLDEPTVGLDPKVRKMFWERISELRQAGKSVLLTTHYMDEAAELCDEIALIFGGRVLVTGTPVELVARFGGNTSIVLLLETEPGPELVEKIKGIVPNSDLKARGREMFIAIFEKDPIECAYAVDEFLKKSGVRVISFILREPTLEDVFLNLVGRAEGVTHAQNTKTGMERA